MARFGSSAENTPVVFFHGDVWLGSGRTSKTYLAQTNEKLQRDADANAKLLGTPYIFFARPGTYGSSGEHMQRRRPGEARLINVALDKTKRRHGIEKFVLSRQSGGGHVTSSLLSYRSDVTCAVPTSAGSSPRILQMLKGRTRDSTGYSDAYEPTEHLTKNRMAPDLRVFVVGNPPDTNVPWQSQTILTTKLREIGVPAETIQAEGTGSQVHGLSVSSGGIASWCAQVCQPAKF